VSGRRDESARLRRSVEAEARRIKQAERDRRTLLSQTVYLGTVGLLFVLPVVGGAYLGLWMDEHLKGFSVHWTLTMIILGVVVGGLNVYLFIRE
jgi:ATP synthase protein I